MKNRIALSLATLTVLALFAPAAPAQSEVTSGQFYLPVAVHVPGKFGAFFKTHVAFYNATSSTFPVLVTLYDSTGTAHPTSFTLGPNQSMAYADFVDEVYHLQTAGTVKFDTGSPSNQIALSAEVYTNGPCGDFGTDTPAISRTLSAAEAISPGVNNNEAQRTNIACYNGASSPNHIVADVFNQENFKVETQVLDLPGNAWNQVSVSGTVNGGYVRFHPSAPAFCYAVVVTNTTNDGRFIPAQTFLP